MWRAALSLLCLSLLAAALPQYFAQQAASKIVVEAPDPSTLFFNVYGQTAIQLNQTALEEIVGSMGCGAKIQHAEIADHALTLTLRVGWNGSSASCNISRLVSVLVAPIVVQPSLFPSVKVKVDPSGLLAGQKTLNVRFVGVDWEATALGLLAGAAPGPLTLTALGELLRARLSRGVGKLRVGATYVVAANFASMAILSASIIGSLALLGPVVGLSYALNQVSEPYPLPTSFAAYFAAAFTPYILVHRRYSKILVRPLEEGVKKAVDRKRLVGFALGLSLVGAFGGAGIGYAEAAMSLHGVQPALRLSATFAMASAYVFGIAQLASAFALAGARKDPRLNQLASEIWAAMGGKGGPPPAYLAPTTVGMKYNAVQVGVFARRIVVAEPLIGALTEGELKSILAHELSHASRRHVLAATLVEVALFTLAFGLLLPVGPALTMQAVALRLLAFTLTLALTPIPALYLARRRESQADLDAAGFDPYAYVSAMGKLAALNGMPAELDRTAEALMSHPAPLKRALKVAQAYKIPRDVALRLFEEGARSAVASATSTHRDG